MEIKTDGIIIKKQPFQEYDEIINVLSPDLGKIKIISKGIKKINNAAAGKLEVFSETSLILHSGRNFYTCVEAEILNSHSKVMTELDSIMCGIYFMETVDKLIPYSEPDRDMYRILKRIIESIEKGERFRLIPSGVYFLLKQAGMNPAADCCCICSEEKNLVCFDVRSGGLVCSKCPHSQDADSDPETVEFMRELPHVRLSILKKRFEPEIFDRARILLERHIYFHLNIILKSGFFAGK